MNKQKRQNKINRRKNFLPSLFVTVFLWLIIGFIFYQIDPNTGFIIPIFFFLLFIALIFTFSLVFVNTRRGVLLSIGLTLFLILRMLGIGNLLNAFLIVLILATIEIYSLIK